MNVLYLNHSDQMSGAENSLRALLWELRRAHDEISPVLALPGSGPLSERMREEGWSVTFAPLRRIQRPQGLISGMTTLVHVMRTAPFIAHLAKKTGAKIIHSNSTTAHIVGGMAAEKIGVPAIWHARDMVSLEKIAPALAQRATCIVAISGCVAEKLQNDGVPAEKIRIVHNGLDPDEWKPRDKSALRETLSLPQGTVLFGCPAQLVPWKNQLGFIEAAAKIVENEGSARPHFAIIGGNMWGEHNDYIKELRDAVKARNLQDHFNFIPHQNDNVDALAALDCVVLPSHEEPFGRVLIEGMALKKAVIAFGENGPLEIVTHGHDGLLVPPEETDGLANAMQKILGDAALREELGRNGHASVIEKFHISESAARIVEIYRDVTAAPPEAASE